MPLATRPSHAGPPRSRAAIAASAAVASAAAVAGPNAKPVPLPGRRELVDDGVGEAAGPPDDRRRPVAHRDHLALTARLEPRRHQEEVGAGVDPAGHRRGRTARAARPGPGAWRRATGSRRPGRVAAAQDDEPGARVEQPRGCVGKEVEALLRIEPADHPQDRRVVGRVEADPAQQVGPAGRLASEVAGRVRRRQVGVGRRVPDGRVEPVEDPEVAVALRPQRRVEPEPQLRPQRLAGVARADGVHQLRALDPRPEQVDPDRVGGDHAVARGEAQVAQRLARRPAVVGEVVDRQARSPPDRSPDRRRTSASRNSATGRRASRGGGAGRPAARRARRPPGAPRARPGRAARTATRCRRSRRRGRPVEAVAVEGGRVVDEPQAVAVRGDVDDRDVDRAGRARAGRGRGPSSSRPLLPEPARSGSAGGRRRRARRSRRGPAAAPGRARRPRRRGRRSSPTARIRPRRTRRGAVRASTHGSDRRAAGSPLRGSRHVH